MLTNISELSKLLKDNGYEVYRDYAEANQEYPFVIYEFVSETAKYASNSFISDTYLYQVSLVTTGVETEMKEMLAILNDSKVFPSSMSAGPYKENDETITQFNCYVRVRNGE